MANRPNLEKAKLESEAYGKMIRDMINALNSDLVDLKVKEDNIKLIPEEKNAPVRKMFGDATRTMKDNMKFLREGLGDDAASARVEKKVKVLEKERMKFMGMSSMQRARNELDNTVPPRKAFGTRATRAYGDDG
tara:strand:+ start:82 stop:483 length:402 start_codon:yes stop_codon:yes gene_type:complete